MSRIGALSLGLVWLAALAMTGCDGSTASGPPDPGSALHGPAIGDPCESSDGWQPAPLVSDDAPASSETPVGTVPPADYVDSTNLPPGVGYCLTPGPVYPSGYFTSNCHGDADCPDGARCDGGGVAGGLCRRPCTSNSECAPPSTCDRGGLVLYCKCLSCAADWVLENERDGP